MRDLGPFLRAGDGEFAVIAYKPPRIDDKLLGRLARFDNANFPQWSISCSREEIMASHTVYVAAYSRNDRIAGVATSNINGRHAAWGSAAVQRSARGRGLYQTLVYLRLLEALSNGLSKIRLETQNPNVEYAIAKVLRYLRAQGETGGHRIRRVLIPHFYEGLVTREVQPESPSDEINRAYAALNKMKGDCFRLFVSIKMPEGSANLPELEARP